MNYIIVRRHLVHYWDVNGIDNNKSMDVYCVTSEEKPHDIQAVTDSLVYAFRRCDELNEQANSNKPPLMERMQAWRKDNANKN